MGVRELPSTLPQLDRTFRAEAPAELIPVWRANLSQAAKDIGRFLIVGGVLVFNRGIYSFGFNTDPKKASVSISF
jgi:hypothetical protein